MRKIDHEEFQQILLDMMSYIDKFCWNNNMRYSLGGGTLLGAIRHKGFIPWDDDMDIMLPRPDYERFIKLFNKGNQSNYRCITYENDKDTLFVATYAKVERKDTTVNEDGASNMKCGISIDIFPLDGIPERETTCRQFLFVAKKLQNSIQIKCTDMNRIKSISKKIYKCFLTLMPLKLLYYIANSYIKKYKFEDSKYAGAVSGIYGLKERYERKVFETYEDVVFEDKIFRIISEYDVYLKQHYSDYMKLPPLDKRINHGSLAYLK